MSLSILGSIGSKMGINVVGDILNKTLPKAFDFMKGAAQAPLDMFESVVNTFGGKASKTKPAKQFMLAFPERLGYSAGKSATDKMKSMGAKFSKAFSALGMVSDALQLLSNLSSGQVQQSGFSGRVMEQTPGSQFGSGMNIDTQAMAESTGYGDSVSGNTEMSPMDMFRKMQEAQQAAQMFEMAVKISEMQHQAAMSAIRGIKY